MFARIWLGLKVFFCYLLPFLPCCPKIGELEDGDCIFVQSFGRNSIPDKDLGKTIWEILHKSKSLSEALTFLRYSGFDPGKPNRALAKKAIRLSKKFKIPIIAQWEVIFVIWESERKWFLDNQAEIDCLWPPELGYYATFHVKLECREKMRARGKSRPIEVCHPAMVARAIPVIWKTGVNVVIEAVHFWSFFKGELWVWDEDSVQPWTRAFVRLKDLREWWLSRESFGRFVHHLLKGWVSFIPVYVPVTI